MRLLLVAALLVLGTCVLVAQTARQDRLDDASIEEAARTLRNAIRSAVSQAGGDLEHQHVHLVLGFSTGHFNQDPLGAQAARQIAWLVVKDLLVAGDKVTCFAWEMTLWDHLQGKEPSVTIADSSPEGKRPINDLFPTTVQDGSQGGHDTERAIVQITQSLGDAGDAVIVLLTNDAQSVASKGQRTIGADNPDYRTALGAWVRLPQVSKSGASLVLPFKVIRVDGSVVDRKLDIVVATPRHFSAAALVGKSRTEQIQQFATTLPSTAPPSRKKSWQGLLTALQWLGAVVALAAVGVLAVRKLSILGAARQSAVTALKVDNQQIDISKVAEGQSVCVLAGEHYKPLEDTPVVKMVEGTDAVLAEMVRQKNVVELHLREAELRQINDEWVKPERTIHPLKMGESYRLHFVIRKPPKPTMPARTQEVNVRIDWVFADSGKPQNGGG